MKEILRIVLSGYSYSSKEIYMFRLYCMFKYNNKRVRAFIAKKINDYYRKKEMEMPYSKYGKILYNIVQDYPKQGVRFIDFTPSIMDVSARGSLISDLYDYACEYFGIADYVICPDARGFIWGSYLSRMMNVGMIPVRKTNKLPEAVIGAVVEYDTEYSKESLSIPQIDLTGKKVLFVDDVYATGGTYRACEELVEKMGGKLIGVVVIYNVGLKEGLIEGELPVVPVLESEDI